MFRCSLWRLVSKRTKFGVSYLSDGQPELEYKPMSFKDKYPRSNMEKLCDDLWQIRRGSNVVVPHRLLFETGGLILTNRGWSEFVDDELVSVWARQMLAKDVLSNLRPPAMLSFIMLNIAKILNAAITRKLPSDLAEQKKRLSEQDSKVLCQLLDRMVDVVFVDRNQVTFKHVSAATEALGRFIVYLRPPEDVQHNWVTAVHDWIRCGRLRKALEPILSNPTGSTIGLTSLTGFLGALPRLNYKPPENDLRLVAGILARLFSDNVGTKFVTSKSLIDSARYWHHSHLDPDTLSDGWWDIWFKAYKMALMERIKLETSKDVVDLALIQTAILMAKDFGKFDQLKETVEITEKKLMECIQANEINKMRAEKLVQSIESLCQQNEDKQDFFSEAVMEKLRRVASV